VGVELEFFSNALNNFFRGGVLRLHKNLFESLFGEVNPLDIHRFTYTIDDGFYAAQYLRAWIFDAQMRAALREEHGDTWWQTREAGAFLRREWSSGQKYGVTELLEGVGYAGLDLDPFVEEIESHLSG